MPATYIDEATRALIGVPSEVHFVVLALRGMQDPESVAVLAALESVVHWWTQAEQGRAAMAAHAAWSREILLYDQAADKAKVDECAARAPLIMPDGSDFCQGYRAVKDELT